MSTEAMIWAKLKIVFWAILFAGLLLLSTCALADYQLYVLDLNKRFDDGTYQIIHTERFISRSDCDDRGFDYQQFAGYYQGRTGWVCPSI